MHSGLTRRGQPLFIDRNPAAGIHATRWQSWFKPGSNRSQFPRLFISLLITTRCNTNRLAELRPDFIHSVRTPLQTCLLPSLPLNQHCTMKLLLSPALLIFTALAVFADGPADNLADKVRRIPPPGVKVPEEVRAELSAGVKSLGDEITKLRGELAGSPNPTRLRLLPDVEIFHKAVDWALRYDEFFNTNQFKTARALLQEGRARAAALRDGTMPWLTATGAVARGYISRIDGSVQPYGLVIPPSVPATDRKPSRLDLWFHGRGETLSELDFIAQRNNPKNLGEFAPADTIVLHPYGRYCNGSRFAGETDAFEAMERLQHEYPVDTNRIVVRGFSLGGASVWHFASHYTSRWAAVAPGAGFSETADFLNVFQKEKLVPSLWEQKLWRLHDSPDWVENYRYLPTVAYSGEIDGQKQAADVMAKAFEKAGMKLTHIIGPQTAHKYHPEAKKQVNELIDGFAAKGRDPAPKQFSFVTYTTRYNEFPYGTVEALDRHWEPAFVRGEFNAEKNLFLIRTTNVAALTLRVVSAEIDGQTISLPPQRRGSGVLHAVKRSGKWSLGSLSSTEPHKRHGLQGPMDDAFMDSFMVVRPTGKPLNEKVGAWAASELAHMTNHWRQHYRGDARVKDDTAVTAEDMAQNNLILFGDPQSNRLIKQMAGKLPIRWSSSGVKAGATNFLATSHALISISPNPLAPARYVVLNSGFTFREYDYLNNARQTPKLPDYAVVDVTQPITSRAPGGIVAAGFFNEEWQFAAKAGDKAK
jgi:dienelactone hydrolase